MDGDQCCCCKLDIIPTLSSKIRVREIIIVHKDQRRGDMGPKIAGLWIVCVLWWDGNGILWYTYSSLRLTLVNIVPSLSPVSNWWNTMVTASLSSAVISSTAARPFRFPSFFVFFFSNEFVFVVGGSGPGDWVPPVPLSSCPTVLIPHIS